MKRTQIINIICSLLLVSLLILSVVSAAIFLPRNGGGGKLVVSSVGMQKEYDGTPLTAHVYKILSGRLKDGHAIIATFSGSRTEIGMSENTFEIMIVDASGRDMTDDYEVELIYGTLHVTQNTAIGGVGPGIGGNASQSVGGGSGVDLGGRISAVDPGPNNGDDLCLRVRNEIDDTVYLKTKSFGAYDGTSWKEAIAYEKLINGSFSMSYLASIALNRVDSRIEIQSMSDQYFLPYYMSYRDFEACDRQTSDVLYSGSTQNVYAVSYAKFDYTEKALLPYSLQGYENNYFAFVQSQYLEMDAETRAYMDRIIRSNRFEGKDLTTVLAVADYIRNSAVYSVNYNRQLNEEENIAVAFLDQYQEGVCQHFASAATLLYRAMGIPARYTVGFIVNTKADEWTYVRGRSAHAWVEVYLEDMGWVQVEVTNGFVASGDKPESKIDVSVTPVTTEKQYDGTPLYAENRVTGFEIYEKMGYTYTAAVNGVRTEVGSGGSIIEVFKIYDPYGADVTEKFNVTCMEGTVRVYYSELIFESASDTRVYNGYRLFTDLSTCKMIGGTLRNGDVVSFSPSTSDSIVNVSVCSANFTVTVHDMNGNLVNDCYKITKQCGLLTVTPREITVKAADATKTYDGTPLSCNEYVITEGSLCKGDYIFMCLIVGTQSGVGRSDNMITELVILNEFGMVVTQNYSIRLETGILQVLPQS